MCLVQEPAVTDTVVDTLAGLSEEELVTADITRLDPCCCGVAVLTLNISNDAGKVSSWYVQEASLEVCSSSWSRSLRCS